jgi:hypothetical protein
MLALAGFLFGRQNIKDRRKRQLHGLDNNIDLGQQQQPRRSPTSRGTDRAESQNDNDDEIDIVRTHTSTHNYDALKATTHTQSHDSDAHSEAHVSVAIYAKGHT